MPVFICLSFDHKFCNDDYFCNCISCGKERYNRDLAKWRKKWEEAKEDQDFDKMDELNRQFDFVGLP